MKRLLITGGSGFLGGHIITLASDKYDVFTTFKRNKYFCDNVTWKYNDLFDAYSIKNQIKQLKPDVIIHNAALSNVDECEIDKDYAYTINVKSTETISRIAFDQNIRLIYISTDMVYDGKSGNYKETDPINPVNYYGRTKVVAEQKIAQICSDYVIVRTALIYGKTLTNSLSFTDNMLLKAKNGKNITLFYDQYRSPVLVDNLAEALS